MRCGTSRPPRPVGWLLRCTLSTSLHPCHVLLRRFLLARLARLLGLCDGPFLSGLEFDSFGNWVGCDLSRCGTGRGLLRFYNFLLEICPAFEICRIGQTMNRCRNHIWYTHAMSRRARSRGRVTSRGGTLTLSYPPAPTVRELSTREQQVAELLLEGCDNPAIARELKIANRTVQANLKRLVGQLEAGGRVGLALKLYRMQCLESITESSVTEDVHLTKATEVVAGLVSQGFTNQEIAKIIKTQPPHLYFSSVLSCTGLADCHCGGKTRLDPARGPGVQVHDGKVYSKDYGCATRASTEGVVKNYLQTIYDKLGFSNQVELALWYEKRRYSRMSPTQQDAYRAMWLKIYERREQQKEAIRITMPLFTHEPGTDESPSHSAEV